MNRSRVPSLLLVLLLVSAGCGRTPTAPEQSCVTHPPMVVVIRTPAGDSLAVRYVALSYCVPKAKSRR